VPASSVFTCSFPCCSWITSPVMWSPFLNTITSVLAASAASLAPNTTASTTSTIAVAWLRTRGAVLLLRANGGGDLDRFLRVVVDPYSRLAARLHARGGGDRSRPVARAIDGELRDGDFVPGPGFRVGLAAADERDRLVGDDRNDAARVVRQLARPA